MFPQPENVENKMLRNAIFGLSCDNYFFPKNLTCEVTHILNVSLVNQLEFCKRQDCQLHVQPYSLLLF